MDAFIYDGLRTPFGRHAGALSAVRPDDLLAGVIAAVVGRNAFNPADFEDVIAGCTNQAGEDSRNVARHAGLMSGLPIEVAGQTVNRLCGSGLAAIIDAGRACATGQGSLFVAGGVECMSRAPFVLSKAESAFSRDARIFDTTMGARFVNPRIVAAVGNDSMPETADNVAADLGITRAEADAFALASQQKFSRAQSAGFFDAELVPVEIKGRRGDVTQVRVDEHPRPSTTAGDLVKLKPLFANGVVTAGNASGINDGAGALIVGTAASGEKAGVKPMARILSAAVAGVAPRVMGLGPAPAIEKALARAGITLDQADVIEINEAFASQVLGCLKLLHLTADDSRVNPNGGAIAVGHPLGASGARLALTTARQLQATGGRYGVVSMCIGVGQGIAMVIERV